METEGWKKVLLWGSFIFFLGSLLLRQESAITQDLGRHLRLGEMIVAGGSSRKCALYSNCLTYTYPDYPFINHHWGSEVIFYLIHKIGGFPALIIFKAIVLGLAFSITLFHSLGLNKGPAFLKRPGLLRLAIAISLTFFSIQMMADRLTARPEIFGYLLFSLLFWLLDKKDLSNWRNLPNLMLIPIIMILWANLHISFVFGVILIWIWTGYQVLTSLRESPDGHRDDRGNPIDRHATSWLAMTVAIPAVSTLVTFLNPFGFRGALMPLSILKDYGYTIVENMTPFFLSAFKPQPEYWIYSIFLVIITILIIISPKKPSFFSISTFYLFSVFPLIAVRHLPFFALVVPVILTPLVSGVLKGPALRRKAGPYPILTAGYLFLVAFTNPVPLTYGKLAPINLTIDSRHNSAVEFVKQNNLQGKMWNNYDIGSYLEWSLPEYPTFVDGRPEAFPVGFFRQTYIPMQENKEVWDRVAAEYDVQWVFAALTDATPWFIKWWKMVQNHPDWRIVYIDNFSAVLVKINGKNNLVEPQGKAKLLETVNLD